MTLTVEPAELKAAIEEIIEEKLPGAISPEKLKELSEVEMHRRRNKEAAATFLGVKERQIEIWMRKKGDRGGESCPHYKRGHCVVFTYATLAEWDEKHRVH